MQILFFVMVEINYLDLVEQLQLKFFINDIYRLSMVPCDVANDEQD